MAPLAIGLDVGGTKILGVVVDPARPAEVLYTDRVPTPRGAEPLFDAAAHLVALLAASAGSVGSVGVGIAGLVDRLGVLHLGPNLPDVVDASVAGGLTSRTGYEVMVLNDASAAAWGEHRAGAGQGSDNLALVTLGTGIGAGFVIEGRLVGGHQGFAGESGHVVVDPNGPPCPCGQRGCWERYASGSGLGRLGREAAEAGRLRSVTAALGGDPESVRGETVTRAAIDGDLEALAVMRDFAWWVALGLAGLINLLDPERIVIGGGLVAAGPVLFDPVREFLPQLLFASDRRHVPEVIPAALGEQAGAIGAALASISDR